ncbi:MAG: recombinase family protein [Candidatus Paceibacterota bacterium]
MEYIIYCRKSSESEDRQILSIDSQENELIELSTRESFNIAKVYKESRTAKDPGREIFEEMLSYVEKSKKEVCLLVWNLDRLARNSVDGGKIIYMMDKGFITEIKTPSKTFKNNPDDKFMMNLVFGFSKKYVDDLSINVKRGNKAKLEKGGWPGVAPLGYLNDKANRSIIVDDERAYYIRRCYNLYATGQYSLNNIVKILREEGFRSRAGKFIYVNRIHRILKDPFYYGFMFRGNNLYKGNYEPIVSKELFDRVQEVFNRASRPKQEKHFFHLRGLMICNKCGCVLTASQKRNHDYYYCTNGKKVCDEHKHYWRSESLDAEVWEVLKNLEFDTELVEICYQSAKEKLARNKNDESQMKESLLFALEGVKKKQGVLIDNLTSLVTPKSLYVAKMKELNDEEVAINKKLASLGESLAVKEKKLDDIKEFFLKTRVLRKEFLDGTLEHKFRVVNTVLWNISIENGKAIYYKAKEPYQLLLNGSKIDDFVKMQGR